MCYSVGDLLNLLPNKGLFKQKPFLYPVFTVLISGLGHVQAETVLVSGFHRSLPVLGMFEQKPFLYPVLTVLFRSLGMFKQKPFLYPVFTVLFPVLYLCFYRFNLSRLSGVLND